MIRPAGGGQSPEPGEQPDTEIAWDDVVDVICVGSDPGPVAHAIAAADTSATSRVGATAARAGAAAPKVSTAAGVGAASHMTAGLAALWGGMAALKILLCLHGTEQEVCAA